MKAYIRWQQRTRKRPKNMWLSWRLQSLERVRRGGIAAAGRLCPERSNPLYLIHSLCIQLGTINYTQIICLLHGDNRTAVVCSCIAETMMMTAALVIEDNIRCKWWCSSCHWWNWQPLTNWQREERQADAEAIKGTQL